MNWEEMDMSFGVGCKEKMVILNYPPALKPTKDEGSYEPYADRLLRTLVGHHTRKSRISFIIKK